MDILYCIGGKGDLQWRNMCLKYSLRSIQKYGKNVGNVYVVGSREVDFLSDNVTYIKVEDTFEHKHNNILNAIVYALENSEIGEEFLYSSDDHFYIKNTDFDNYPYYCKGKLSRVIKKPVKYRASLANTKKVLERKGYTTHNFSWHGNTHMSRKAIEMAMPLIKKSFGLKFGCEPTCLILNTLYSKEKFSFVKRDDLKIKDISEIDKNRECFSCYENVIGLEEWLKKKFPRKCKYEL